MSNVSTLVVDKSKVGILLNLFHHGEPGIKTVPSAEAVNRFVSVNFIVGALGFVVTHFAASMLPSSKAS